MNICLHVYMKALLSRITVHVKLMMQVCTCIRTHVRTCVCTHIHTHARSHAHTCTCTDRQTDRHMHARLHTYACPWRHTHSTLPRWMRWQSFSQQNIQLRLCDCQTGLYAEYVFVLPFLWFYTEVVGETYLLSQCAKWISVLGRGHFWFIWVSYGSMWLIVLISLCGKDVGHYMQTVQQNFFHTCHAYRHQWLTILYHFHWPWPYRGHKVSAKQNLLASFSRTLFIFSGWNLMWFKLNIWRLLLSKIYWNKDNNCFFTDWVKKLECWHAFRCLPINWTQMM